MDNNARSARVQALVSDISSCQLDAVSHQEDFKKISELAYGSLQDYLKSKNMKTTDELVKEVIKELPPKEQEEILSRLKELSPPTGMEFFLQPSELAKFMLYGYLGKAVITVVKPYFFRVKSWWLDYQTRAVLQSAKSAGVVTEDVQALRQLSQADREALLKRLGGERVDMQNEMFEEYGFQLPEEVMKDSAKMEEALADVRKAVESVEKIEAAEADALTAAAQVSIWTKVTIVVSVVALIGLAVYDKVKEHQITDELRETIKKVGTARLYARMSERMELVHTDQISSLRSFARAYDKNQKALADDILDNFADDIEAGLKDINEDSTYQMLAEQDQSVHADTREDPSLDEMKKRRAAEANSPLPDKLVS